MLLLTSLPLTSIPPSQISGFHPPLSRTVTAPPPQMKWQSTGPQIPLHHLPLPLSKRRAADWRVKVGQSEGDAFHDGKGHVHPYVYFCYFSTILLLGRKAETNLDSILKSRDITLSTKVRLVKAMVFTVVMYGCESWTIKKNERWRIDVFELWCWRRLLWVPWTARRSNQSILKEISPEYSLEELILKLKFQYFGHLMRRTDSLEKTLALGKIQGGRRRRRQRMASLTWWTWVWARSRSWWWTGKPGVLQSMGSERVGHDWVTKLNWTILLLIW